VSDLGPVPAVAGAVFSELRNADGCRGVDDGVCLRCFVLRRPWLEQLPGATVDSAYNIEIGGVSSLASHRSRSRARVLSRWLCAGNSASASGVQPLAPPLLASTSSQPAPPPPLLLSALLLLLPAVLLLLSLLLLLLLLLPAPATADT
jgi:hypothetical protein